MDEKILKALCEPREMRNDIGFAHDIRLAYDICFAADDI